MTQDYFRKTAAEALRAQNTSEQGLSAQEAAQRLQTYGKNKLSEGKKKSIVRIFAEQFRDLMVCILMIAAIISACSGNVESTIVIFAVLILNAVLGTVQYVKAEKSLESLKAMASPTAKGLRDGARVEIDSALVVPGDIVLLEAGDMVTADGRILENFSLKVNESSLTGESEGVDKQTDVIDAEQVALGDQKNMVFSGSLVTYGRASVLVTATGMHTELGKIAARHGNAEDGAAKCHHQGFEGGRELGQRVRHLLGQNRHADAKQNDAANAVCGWTGDCQATAGAVQSGAAHAAQSRAARQRCNA